jgi:hypothetical protein
MRKQQPTDVLARTVQGERQVRRRTFRVMEVAALIDACGHFVAQLDAYPVGAAIIVCIVALAAAGAIVITLALTLRAAPASCGHVSKGKRCIRR